MEARLLYGSIEIEADEAIQALSETAEQFDKLAESAESASFDIDTVNEVFSAMDAAMNQTASTSELLASAFDSITESIPFKIFMELLNFFMSMIVGTSEFQAIIQELVKAFEPMMQLLGEFAKWIAKTLSALLMPFIKALGSLIKYFTKTVQGISLLKTGLIFLASVISVVLVASLKTLAASFYSTLTAFTAMITPLMPFIITAVAVAAAITTLILVLEDLYYFATGEGDSVAADFFAMIGLDRKQIEEIRQVIKDFIIQIKQWWNNFTSGLGGLVPQMKKIFSALLDIAKSFFVNIFRVGYNLIGVFTNIWKIVKGIFTGNFSEIKDGFKGLLDSVKNVFSGIWDFIKDGFAGLLDMLTPLKELFAGLFSAVSGDAPKKIEKRAGGGEVKKGESYIVGDGGEEEIFTAGANGFITPKSKLESGTAAGKQSGSALSSLIGTINISVNTVPDMAKELESKIREAINKMSIDVAQELGVNIR